MWTGSVAGHTRVGLTRLLCKKQSELDVILVPILPSASPVLSTAQLPFFYQWPTQRRRESVRRACPTRNLSQRRERWSPQFRGLLFQMATLPATRQTDHPIPRSENQSYGKSPRSRLQKIQTSLTTGTCPPMQSQSPPGFSV